MFKAIRNILGFALIFIIMCGVLDGTVMSKNLKYDEFVKRLSNNEFSELTIRPKTYEAIALDAESSEYFSTKLISFESMEEIVLQVSEENPDFKYEINAQDRYSL